MRFYLSDGGLGRGRVPSIDQHGGVALAGFQGQKSRLDPVSFFTDDVRGQGWRDLAVQGRAD